MVDVTEWPAFATLERWIELSGVSRSRCYELLSSGDLVGRKLNSRVLIDVHAGLAFLDSLPRPCINSDSRIHRKPRSRS
jgi:hypothetical protein